MFSSSSTSSSLGRVLNSSEVFGSAVMGHLALCQAVATRVKTASHRNPRVKICRVGRFFRVRVTHPRVKTSGAKPKKVCDTLIPMRRVVVNADDLGVHPKIDE